MNLVRTSLLVALSEGPGFGLELIARVKTRARGRLRLNRGGTYLALRRLEAEKLVRGWSLSTGVSGRPRRYYELTSRGIAELERARELLEGLTYGSSHRHTPLEGERMAERVRRSSRLTTLALQVREAALRAGLQ